jgi:putative drug exporter of the RND superfamily
MHSFFAATGRFAVRFRWAIVVAWVTAAVLASLLLPSLASVVKESNTDLLPASSPSLSAARLATPFQGPDQSPVLVVVARDSGTVSAADFTAIGRLTARLAKVADAQQVKDLGASADRQAVQLEVLSDLNLTDFSNPGPAQHLVAGLRAAIAASALPPGLRAHLAGPAAAAADASQTSQKATSLGLDLIIVFIVVLLLVVFRSLLAPLLTLAPAVLVTQLAGPVLGEAGKAGLPVSSLSYDLMLILTIGAGTDYGLFLVFRVREELRAGRAPRDAVTRALARVGESMTFSAATVIAALLTLMLATIGRYSSLGAPLAISLAFMLLADLTLLPALLAIAGRAAFWPSRTARGTGRIGWWGRVASFAVARPAATLALGLVVFGALATAMLGYRPAGLGAAPAAPGGSDSAAGNALLAAHFPVAISDPTTVVLRFREPAWDDPAPAAAAQRRLAALPQFNDLTGPFGSLTPGRATSGAAAGEPCPARHVGGVPRGEPVHQPRRADHRVRRHAGRRRPGLGRRDPSGAGHPGGRRRRGPRHRGQRLRRRRRGASRVRPDPGLRRRPAARLPGRDPRHRGPAGARLAQPHRPALPHRLRRAQLPGGVGPVRPALPGRRPGRRALLRHPVPDVHFLAGTRRGLQHPGDDPDPGGGRPDATAAGGDPGHAAHRLDG